MKAKPEALRGVKEFDSRYRLSEEEIRWRSRMLVEQQATPEMLEPPFSCYELDWNDPFSNLARAVELEVFLERFNNTEKQLVDEYGPYEEHSKFFIIMNHDGFDQHEKATNFRPMGVMRIIEPSPNGLKSLVDLPSSGALTETGHQITPELVYEAYGIDPGKCIDIATLAVCENWRGAKAGHVPTLLLFRKLFLQYLRHSAQFTHSVAIMDLEAKRGLDAMRMPFIPILGAKPFPYLDNNPGAPQTMSQPIIAKNETFFPTVTGWAERYLEEADELEEFINMALERPEEFTGIDIDLAQQVAVAKKERTRKRTFAMGMNLLAYGQVGEGEVVIDIDKMLASIPEPDVRPLFKH